MQDSNRRRLSGHSRYTVGSATLLYICLMVWLYVMYPAALGAIVLVGLGVMAVGLVDRVRPSRAASENIEPR